MGYMYDVVKDIKITEIQNVIVSWFIPYTMNECSFMVFKGYAYDVVKDIKITDT